MEGGTERMGEPLWRVDRAVTDLSSSLALLSPLHQLPGKHLYSWRLKLESGKAPSVSHCLAGLAQARAS